MIVCLAPCGHLWVWDPQRTLSADIAPLTAFPGSCLPADTVQPADRGATGMGRPRLAGGELPGRLNDWSRAPSGSL